MRRRRSSRGLLLTLAASILLHLVVFASVRLPRKGVRPEVSKIEAVQVEWIAPLPPDPEPVPVQPVLRAAAPADTPRRLPAPAPAPARGQPAAPTLLAGLKSGMQPATALKREPLAVDDAAMRFEDPSAADAILAAPYPFPRVGGVRLGLGGGGNCPAVPTFP